MSNNNKQSLWSRNFIIVIVATFFTGIVMGILDSCLSLFASDMYQSNTLGGYLTSFFNAGGIIMAFFAGRLVDISGRKRMFVFGCLLFAIPTFICAAFPTPAISLGTRFIQGLGKGITSVAAASLVADIIPANRLGEGMALYGMGSTLARAFGPSIGLNVSAMFGYNVMFLVSAILYLAGGVIMFLSDYEKKPEFIAAQKKRLEAAKSAKTDTEYTGIWKLIEKKAFLASINYTIFFAGTAALLVFNSTFSKEVLGLSASQIGVFYLVSAGAMIVGRTFLGKLSDINALYALIPSYICLFLMYFILMNFCVGNYFMYLVAAVLYGFATCVVMSTYNTIAIVDSPEGRNAAANAVFYFLQDFGVLIASAVFGVVIDAASSVTQGYMEAFMISIIISVIALAMTLILFGNKARARRRQKA